MSYTLYKGDCLEEMKKIADGSVDAIICDPPYGTMKGAGLDGWHAGKTDWDDCLDTTLMLEQCNRILRMNGALILFSQEPYTSRLITESHGNLPFSYRMIWLKDHFANALVAKKAPVSYFEDVLVFFKKYDTLSQHPLRDYTARLFDHVGKCKREFFSEMGHQGVCHFMRYDTMQWQLCTQRTYDQLCSMYGIEKLDWFIPYMELKREDDLFKASVARTFNLPTGGKYKSNVLQYRKDYAGLHPTQKPVALMEDLVKTYTNPCDTVLDFTMGSGSTGVACANTGRKFIGIERDEKYFDIAKSRIEQAFDGRLI